MKRIIVVCLVLFGVSLFSGCKDYDDLRIIEMSSEKPAMVKTEISLAIAGIKAPQATRMSESIVQGQEEPLFRGIQGVRLFAHVKDPENADEAKRDFWKEIILPTVDPDNQHQSSDAVAQFYADVEIPLNTTDFRFYGEAKKKSGDGDANNGVLIKNGGFSGIKTANLTASEMEGFAFDLMPIQTTVDDKANALADYLTAIAHELNTQGFTDAYSKLIKNTAGSSANVFALVSQLYANIEDGDEKDAVKAVIDGTDQSTLAGYPAGLPDGTARMAWDSDNDKFVVPDDASSILFDDAPLSAYVSPPALYYYIESGVRTSSTIHMYGYADWLYARQHGYSVKGVQDYDTSWKHFLDMYEYKSDEKVNVYSHSVALADEIRYAVSRLDVTIRANSSSLTDAAGRQVHFTASAFPIRGILVGDQGDVTYEFKPNGNRDKVIYDIDMPDGMILSTTKSPVNSTLVLESAQDDASTTDKDESIVRVAVEFENNSGFDIYGKSEDNSSTKPIIPHGTKFYLIGELSLSDAEQPKEDEPSLQDRVFRKGAVTKVDFVVSNFEYAYNVVPDLRNPRLMLGLSANLHWQSGIIIPTEI